jgi:hypothetical protein
MKGGLQVSSFCNSVSIEFLKFRDQTIGILFVVSQKVIRSHLRQEHLNRWKTCKGCHQSKTLISEPLPRRIKELQAMNGQKLWGC